MKDSNLKKDKNNFTKFIGLSSQMVSTVILFSLIGYFIDKNTDYSKPYFLGLFCVFGVLVSLFNLFKKI